MITCIGGCFWKPLMAVSQRQFLHVLLQPWACGVWVFSCAKSYMLCVCCMQALEVPARMGVAQGIAQGVVVGFTNLTFLGSYALAFWYGSTRVRAGAYDGAPLFARSRSLAGPAP